MRYFTLWIALLASFAPLTSLAAKKALLLSDGDFGWKPNRKLESALKSRGYRTSFHEEISFKDARNYFKELVDSSAPGDQIVIALGCHGGITNNMEPEEVETHECCLNKNCSESISAKEMRELAIRPLIQKGIHPVLIEESCGSGSTVLAMKDLPEACVISTTNANTISFSETTNFDVQIRDPSRVKVRTFEDVAVRAKRYRIRLSKDQPTRTSFSVNYSGCANPDFMRFREKFVDIAESLGDWELRDAPIYKSVYPDRDIAPHGSLDGMVESGCRRLDQLSDINAAVQGILSKSLLDPLWKTTLTEKMRTIIYDYKEHGVIFPYDRVKNKNDLFSEIKKGVDSLKKTHQTLVTTLLDLNNSVEERMRDPDHASPKLESKIEKLRKTVMRLHQDLHDEETMMNSTLNVFEEISCSVKPSPCRSAKI